MTRMINLTLQHCTPDLEDKLKVTTGFQYVHQTRDAIGLLGMIRDVAHNHTEDKNEVMTCIVSDLTLYTYAQGPKKTNPDYSKHFQVQVKTVKAHEGHPLSHQALAKLIHVTMRTEICPDKGERMLKDTEIERVHKESITRADKQYLACLFIALMDDGWYLELKQDLRNMYLFKQDKYPKMIVEALGLLKNYMPCRLAIKKQGETKTKNGLKSLPSSKTMGCWQQIPAYFSYEGI